MRCRKLKISDISNGAILEKVELSDQEEDNCSMSNVSIFKGKLFNLGMKHAQFSSCNIKQTYIEKSYFRYAIFVNVDFTGTKFIECDFEKAKFNSCNLRYVTFEKCKLNIEEVLGCLPTEPNLKVALLKELRKNQLSLAENKSSDELLIMIQEAEKELLRERVKSRTSYYRERENIISRTIALVNYTLLIINDFIWGYGVRLAKLFRTGLLAILFFGFLIYTTTGKEYIVITEYGNKMIRLNVWQSLYASYTNFTTIGYGRYTPTGVISNFIFVIENFVGLIFIGFLVAGVYRRISK